MPAPVSNPAAGFVVVRAVTMAGPSKYRPEAVAGPSKYRPEAVARIVEAIELGATYEHAAAYGGISYQTFCNWRDAFPAFSEAAKSAEAKAAVGLRSIRADPPRTRTRMPRWCCGRWPNPRRPTR